MGYKIRWTNCGRCKVCKADKKARPHGPYLLIRVSRTGGKKEVEHIGRWQPKPPLPEQECAYCGEKFTPRTTWQSYCCHSHRQLGYMKRKEQFPEIYGGEPPQKASEPTMTKQKKQELVQPPLHEVIFGEIDPRFPLETHLFAAVNLWEREYGLTRAEFEDVIEKVWYAWEPKRSPT